jgi:hypothetical protein
MITVAAVIAMFTLLKFGEGWLILSAIASTFYIMIGMQMTDRDRLLKQSYNRLRQARRNP